MARVHVINLDTERAIEVTLSRRNLLALLHKLDAPWSARTIMNGDCWEDGEQTPYPGEATESTLPPTLLVLRAEEDTEHYAARPDPPGDMHPATEAYIRERGGWSRQKG